MCRRRWQASWFPCSWQGRRIPTFPLHPWQNFACRRCFRRSCPVKLVGLVRLKDVDGVDAGSSRSSGQGQAAGESQIIASPDAQHIAGIDFHRIGNGVRPADGAQSALAVAVEINHSCCVSKRCVAADVHHAWRQPRWGWRRYCARELQIAAFAFSRPSAAVPLMLAEIARLGFSNPGSCVVATLMK